MRRWLRKNQSLVGRVSVAVASCCVAFMGLAALRSDYPSYRNYWGGEVGAIPALIIGGLGLFVALFVPKAFESPRNQGGRDRSKKRSKSSQVSPLDDFRKW